jgi:hypothetical protein
MEGMMSELPPVVVARIDPSGRPAFEELRCRASADNLTGASRYQLVWEFPGIPDVPSRIGELASDLGMPKPGGVKVGRAVLFARSAGKTDVTELFSDAERSGIVVPDDNPAMHQTDTVDVEFIISGKVDVIFPSGEKRTLQAGDFMVMGGVPHEWSNPYDEDCVLTIAVVGAERTTS